MDLEAEVSTLRRSTQSNVIDNQIQHDVLPPKYEGREKDVVEKGDIEDPFQGI